MTTLTKNFIDREKLYGLLDGKVPTELELKDLLNKALQLKGLGLEDTAALLRVQDSAQILRIQEAAKIVKETIYGKRLVLFAPVYTGNKCSNSCSYCAFRQENTDLKRTVLTIPQIESEVRHLLRDGHKRILLICGESEENPLDFFIEGIRASYGVRENKAAVKRINVEIAPLTTDGFRKLSQEKIGTYVCFQETYDPLQYKKYHFKGPKADYENRLYVMDRAMEAGIEDVGIGALLGLNDYRFEVLAMMEHARHLEETFDCGPHTVSVPRIEQADNAPISTHIPHQVSDADFKKLVAIIRLALPYTGIILSTRESAAMRTELFEYGISQISAGSRTNPGAYSATGEENTGAQFSLGDHRSLEEVISELIDRGYVPSFCTGCYRKGRIGADFMDLAKPGLIKDFCLPNGLFTFKEYLEDFAKPEMRQRGMDLIRRLTAEVEKPAIREKINTHMTKIEAGERDVYL